MITSKCEQFAEFCKNNSNVIECHRLAESYNYSIKVLTSSVPSLESFIDDSMSLGQPSTLIRLSLPVDSRLIQ
ncbi:Lrp/AsnC ligand binding domain-containing protein [Niallia circulans]|uniref:Lrp/AsnC ligand binding domain-containing protein n=1 Tax=Niallia circulans TaxID=1397 RepID=UPI00325C22D3